jgi:hypothetical protein
MSTFLNVHILQGCGITDAVIISVGTLNTGVHSGVVVKALRYKPAGHRFDSQWCHWNFSVT